jgi:transposase-like protein
MPKPYPEEFRRDVVAVARKGETSLTQIAKDFGISQSCVKNWLKRHVHASRARRFRSGTYALLSFTPTSGRDLPRFPGDFSIWDRRPRVGG